VIRRVRPYVWSTVDQGSSSVTNLGLSIVAARTLGPAGLGTTLIGFSAYLLALGVQRAVITEPLVTSSTRERAGERRAATRAALTSSMAYGDGSTLLLLLIGVALSGPQGRGTLLFAPWVALALLQDFFRTVLFRDGRARAAALTDILWLVAAAAAAPLSWVAGTIWMPSIAWGAGALVGAATGAFAVRLLPAVPRRALVWFRSDAWAFGKWLAGESIAYNGSAYVLVWIVTLIIGAGAFGGLRATQSVFAPLSLLAPVVALPGLPAVSRSLGTSVEAARRIAVRLGGVLFSSTLVYVVAVGSWPSLLGFVFGGDFSHYGYLLWPVGLAQVMAAATGCLLLLIKAQRRGPTLIGLRLLGSLSLVGFSIPLALVWGALGVAWAGVASAAVFSLATLLVTNAHNKTSAVPATAQSQ
jgi:O-antigen/teichoic acid export membrane protein